MTLTLPPLKQNHSPNFNSRAGTKIDLLVEHDTQGGYSGAVFWLCNAHSDVSAHFVVKEDGSEATQLVPISMRAWHACDFNSRSIGKEWSGYETQGYGEGQLQANANITAWLLHEYGIPPIWSQNGMEPGFCTHRDLGVMGGSHDDPFGDDANDWLKYVARVQEAYKNVTPGQVWGQHNPMLDSPMPSTRLALRG
jgi:N-acetyl-anhydromuramyl-L-alanine amidase AmpD